MEKSFFALSLAALVAGAAGCATTVAGAMGMNQARPVAETMTSRHGVCAYADTGSFLGGTSGVKACARTVGQEDSRRAVIVSEFTSAGDSRWNPGNWRVELTAADGRVLLQSTFPMVEKKSSTLEALNCLLVSTCIFVGRNTETLSEPWAPGTYQVRYTYLPDNKPIEMNIVLQ